MDEKEAEALKQTIQTLQQRLDVMELSQLSGAGNSGTMMQAFGDDIPSWLPRKMPAERSHPFKVTVDSGLDVDVESGYVYGLWDGDGKLTATAASLTLANNATNKVYLRVEVSYDAPDSPLILTDDSLDENYHLNLSATILSGTSIPANTYYLHDKTTGYKYYEIAEVETSGGQVTSIYQRISSDITQTPSGAGWITVN